MIPAEPVQLDRLAAAFPGLDVSKLSLETTVRTDRTCPRCDHFDRYDVSKPAVCRCGERLF